MRTEPWVQSSAPIRRETNQLSAGENLRDREDFCEGCWNKIQIMEGKAGIRVLASSGLLRLPAKTDGVMFVFLHPELWGDGNPFHGGRLRASLG